MSDEMLSKKFIVFIFYALALAMGVAIIILPLLGQSVDPVMTGIALFCLALGNLSTAADDL